MINGVRVLSTPSSMSQMSHGVATPGIASDEFWSRHLADTERHGFRVIDLEPDGGISSKVIWLEATARTRN